MEKSEMDRRLSYMDGQIKTCELYAHYWMAMATTGAAARRNVEDGNGRQLTDEEKTDRALQTARQHIHNLRETNEAREDFLRGYFEQ